MKTKKMILYVVLVLLAIYLAFAIPNAIEKYDSTRLPPDEFFKKYKD
jgi:hypothetical protein